MGELTPVTTLHFLDAPRAPFPGVAALRVATGHAFACADLGLRSTQRPGRGRETCGQQRLVGAPSLPGKMEKLGDVTWILYGDISWGYFMEDQYVNTGFILSMNIMDVIGDFYNEHVI